MGFKEISVEELQFNPFTKIGKEWMLVTAGDETSHNTMTASWGGVGVMWGKNVVSVYIRPQRYTKEFVDANDTFTLSFYDEAYKKALGICGSKSGRDCDKEAEAGLTPYYVDGTTAFEEANMILVCKKQYHQDMAAEHFDEKENDEKCYPQKDYHTMYMAEIVKVLVKE
ncbi:flavin reductase family protein [Faecalicatena orotica]|uniref:Flavin reductase (DIM6/NTAB) family NADH-FMN oxidoreductase RutF n=1 Tax=Faecalicatena orotica TaxID=1544 RepID=A0A2Y9BMC4_9FIRM|nr:flavin reductase [Faecalicatena orotica]PWJ18357.1 flavin reductase (DIM6/NTAB) family NADH-FMN oxidoreductase RutF [Faecalicatena orotica]SSA58726.1 NADH-FMN oxidoreductase RutF, flavin reductase (DIM6/NTAB) family [Faecalicatena orotica]